MTDLELLARIIQCEAGGEGEQGMKAVACVVMNRVNVSYGEYGRLEPTIRAVIYQPKTSTTCRWRRPTTTSPTGPLRETG